VTLLVPRLSLPDRDDSTISAIQRAPPIATRGTVSPSR